MNRLALPLCLLLAGACGGSPAPAASPSKPTSAAPAELTTADAVMEGSLAAQGGRDRMSKITSLRTTGTLRVLQMGLTGTVTTQSAPPRNSITTMDLPGFGKVTQGIKDDVAWEMSPMTGNRLISGAERDQLLREATFNADLVWKTLYPKAELAGSMDFHGTPAYKVVLTATDGSSQTRYFAKDTLLMIGLQMVADSQMGKMPIEIAFSDYRDIGGIKVPYKMLRREGPQTVELVIDAVEHDAPIPPGAFDIPAEIAKLQPAP